ncbi:hypothetical protein CLOP_g13953 [Closterium sp. NIES-67]|nr:hypothetical protein CLOP_g13953 [Closterium sp. NIES-67]
MGRRQRILQLLILLLLSFTASCSSVIFNDDKYPTLGVNVCTAPRLVKCSPACNATSGTEGHYVVPFPRCTAANSIKSTTNVYCGGNAISRIQCCKLCGNRTTCNFWQHHIPPNPACLGCGACYIYPAAAPPPTCATTNISYNGIVRLNANASTLGKPCAEGKDDPHFRGGHGTRFEFNGLPDRTFCLLTDRNLHVNMRMRGYYDTRTVGASILKNGLAIRTWIRELGIMWVDAKTRRSHSFRLLARDGKETARGKGYLKEIEYGGRMLPLLKLGGRYALDGGLRFSFDAYESQGGGHFDVDAYHLEIADLLDLDIKLRVAHPLLQTPDDAEAHINVQFLQVLGTPEVHGIVGQTYREGREKRTVTFAELAELTGRPIAADGEEGKGFLDGDVIDYTTTGVLTADCPAAVKRAAAAAAAAAREKARAAQQRPRPVGNPHAAAAAARNARSPATTVQQQQLLVSPAVAHPVTGRGPATTATSATAAKPTTSQGPVAQRPVTPAVLDKRAGVITLARSNPDRHSSLQQPAIRPTLQRSAAAAVASASASASGAAGTPSIGKPAATAAVVLAAPVLATGGGGAASRAVPAARAAVGERRMGSVLRIAGLTGRPRGKAAGLIGVGAGSVVGSQPGGVRSAPVRLGTERPAPVVTGAGGAATGGAATRAATGGVVTGAATGGGTGAAIGGETRAPPNKAGSTGVPAAAVAATGRVKAGAAGIASSAAAVNNDNSRETVRGGAAILGGGEERLNAIRVGA